MNRTQKMTIIALAIATMLTGACAKKKLAVTPPAPKPTVAQAEVATPAPAPARVAENRPPAAATPASPYPNAAVRARIDELLGKIEDAYFDYNKASLRPDAQKALLADSSELRDILKGYPEYKLVIEGHCDERGSAEFNLALGDKRAEAAKEYLVQVGIPSGQLGLVSYGKEKPVCHEHDEACWQRNRRIHIVATAQLH
jgi:peptidoglycan-associated lipoprotein